MVTQLTSLSLKQVLTVSTIAASLLACHAFAASPLRPNATEEPVVVVNTSSIHPLVTIQQFNASDYQSQETTKMFPAPNEDMVQHIVTMTPLDNEAHFKIELEIGQTQMVDCNKHGLNGELKEVVLTGWGYTYYQVTEVSAGPSTMMACFDQAKTSEFVRIPQTLLINYDSRLPKVFYLPQGVELRVRTWQVSSDFLYSAQ